MTTGFLCIALAIILCCFILYCRCPGLLKYVICCFRNSVQARIAIVNMKPLPMSASQNPVSQAGYAQPRQSGTGLQLAQANLRAAPEQAQPLLAQNFPSAPAMHFNQAAQVARMLTCANGYSGCYCIQDGACRGPIQQRPAGFPPQQM